MRRVNTTPLDNAIAAAGRLNGQGSGISRIASACGTSKQFINKMRRHWRETGQPPRALREHAAAIERACGGAVRAEVLYPAVEFLRDDRGVVIGYTVAVVATLQPAVNDPAQAERMR